MPDSRTWGPVRGWGRPPSANGPIRATTGADRGPPYGDGALLVVLCDVSQSAEGVCVTHREIGEHLPVDLHAALPEPRHESAIAHAVEPGRCVDPGDPERAELALLLAPVAVGVPHGAFGGLLGCLVELAQAAARALRGLHDL